MDNSKPVNFLLIITDQQRADHLGCYGNGILRTPNIDALAARGLRADEFHVASPICQPNRGSLMTGRMPSVHGVRHNGIDLDLGASTFVDVLRLAGYRTALVGKSHLQNITRNAAHWPPSPADRLAREARVKTPGEYGQEQAERWEEDPAHDMSLPYYGFEQVALSINHADSQFGHYRRWLRAQRADADALLGPENALHTPDYELAKCHQAWRTRCPEELYPTAWVTDQTISIMRNSVSDGKPFFIQCSYPDPHHPFTPPGRYWDMYRPEDVELPASFHGAHRGAPPHLLALHAQRDAGKAVKHTPALFACSEREAREAIALNYGNIACIDAGVGRLIAAIEQLGIGDNTVVIFTSDHGEYAGDHQLLLKGPIHYRGVTRVPFIWADPDFAGGKTTPSLLQTTDIAPTVLERAGVAAYNGIQGHSLSGLLVDPSRKVRDTLVIEEEGQRVYMGFPGRIRMRSLLDGRYRLSLYDGVEWGELYDLREDPHELVNLWDEDRGLRRQLMEAFAYTVFANSDTSPYPDTLA